MKRMTKLSAVSSALAMVGALAVSGEVLAEQVTGTLDSYEPLSNSDRVIVSISALPGGGSFSGTEYAGLGYFTQQSGPLLTYNTNKFVSFCVDLSDNIGVPSGTKVWDVVSLGDAANTPSGPMGDQRAAALALLLGSNDPGSGGSLNDYRNLSTDVERAAMQVAVWEVAFETPSTAGSYSLSTGNAKFTTTGSGDSATILSTAQGYLDNMTVGISMGGLVGLTSTETQDFIGQVPIPAAAWLFGSALIGAVGLGRRKPTVAA
jgi:hypothetical protein